MSNAEPNTKIKVHVDTQLKEPSLFKLIYVNDNETAMEFVDKNSYRNLSLQSRNC